MCPGIKTAFILNKLNVNININLILARNGNQGWLLPVFHPRGGINQFFQVISAFSSVTISTFTGFLSSPWALGGSSQCRCFIYLILNYSILNSSCRLDPLQGLLVL